MRTINKVAISLVLASTTLFVVWFLTDKRRGKVVEFVNRQTDLFKNKIQKIDNQSIEQDANYV